ncbi:hypothetical protein [Janibacter melonis]|uniref:hypothetical protein n=1 Tax=Janibacter melonis TaxID=262209 RepID=UPI002094308F|nr:hypothetical protein [Janibacter melonis]
MGIHLHEITRWFMWSAPFLLLGAGMIAVALMRRDSGRWWQLLAGAGVMMLVSQMWQVISVLATPRLYRTGLPWWILSAPQTILTLVTCGLLLGAVLVDRPRAAGATRPRRRPPPPRA